MKSQLVHLMNKYPDHRVESSSGSISVRDSKSGELIVYLEKNVHGIYVDRQDLGARDAFCYSPIPKDARQFKLYKEERDEKGQVVRERIGKAEEHDERKVSAKNFLDDKGRIKSEVAVKLEELEASRKPKSEAKAKAN